MDRGRRLLAWALPAVSLLLAGCGGSQVSIVVRASKDANSTRPVYVLVRSIDEKTHLAESYQTVAGKVMTPDDSVLGSGMIFPGAEKKIEVKRQGDKLLGVYVLFTRPSGEWKVLVPSPSPGKLRIELKGNRLAREGDD
jgi:hypothetical protein